MAGKKLNKINMNTHVVKKTAGSLFQNMDFLQVAQCQFSSFSMLQGNNGGNLNFFRERLSPNVDQQDYLSRDFLDVITTAE